MTHAPKIAAQKKHPVNILYKEKYALGTVFALLNLNIAIETTK